MTNATLRGKPDAGNPHVRFEEGEVAPENPRRGSLLYKKVTIVFLSFVQMLAVHAAGRFEVTFDHPNAVYKCGEEAVVTVRAVEGNGTLPTSGIFTVVVSDWGTNRLYAKVAKVPLENPLTFRATLKEPGFLKVRATRGAYQATADSAAFEPEKLRPGSARPTDFDAFWDDAVRKLDATVPLDAKKVLVPTLCTKTVDYYQVSFATFGGRRVYGSMTVPKDKKLWPLRTIVEVPGAGPFCTASGFPTIHKSRYRQTSIHFLMNVHTYAPCDKNEDQYKAYAEQDKSWGGKYGVKRYCEAGISESREAYFYYAAILGINRAVDWLAKEPEVDPKRIAYSGVSQGGGFGFFLMALNRHFEKGVAYVPALTDHCGHLVGRTDGWPNLVKAQPKAQQVLAEKFAPYFDACHFAPRITCPIRVAVGFADGTCPPTAVYSAYNSLRSEDRKIVHGIGMSHDVHGRRNVYDPLQAWVMRDGVDIRDFGAATNAVPAVNAKAIQLAIEAAAKGKGGGRVIVPAGEWVSGTLWLQSGVDLHLEKGAVLKASPNLADYNEEDAYPENWGCPKDEYWRALHFIICRGAENVAITGEGTIDGNGDVFFDEKPLAYFSWMKPGANCWWNGIRWAKDKVNLRPGQLVVFVKSKKLRVEGVTIRNSPCWCLFFYGCRDVVVRDYTVRCGENDGNTDGVDVDCSQNVLLENLDIETGDDAVAIRSGGWALKLDPIPPCENVTVRNARLASNSSVFRIGVGKGLIRNVTVENVQCKRGGTAIMMNTHWGVNSGVDMENLTFRNCQFENVREGHMIIVGKRNLKFGIRNVLFDNVTYPKNVRTACRGNDQFQPTNIRFERDKVQLSRAGRPLAEIVIAPVATRSARFGALELQGHLKAITGADFAIVTPTNRTAGRLPIYVGDSAPAQAIAPDLTALAKSELLVLTRPEAIVLAGEDEPDFCTNHPPRLKYHTLSSFDAIDGYPARWSKHGTLDAVYEFLENHCGVNWFDFSDDGTDYVENPSLSVSIGDRRVRPFVNCRNLEMDSELWPHPCDGSYRERVVTFPNAHQPTRWCDAVIYTQRELFRLRRRVSGELECCNHSFYDWYDRFWNTNSPAFVARHPEYFAKQAKRQNQSEVFIESYYDPSRQPPQLCYSNPEVIRQVIADVRDYFDHGGTPVRDGKGKIVKYKPIWGRDTCSLEPMDNDGFCQCARCRAEYPSFVTNTSPWIGTTRNDHWFGFVNKVAREVKKTHPTKRISTLAYMSHTAPPFFPMEDNVVVHFCYTGNRMPHGVSLNARLDSQLLDWVKVLKKGNLGIWFYNCFPHDGVGGQSSEFMCCPGNFLDLHYRQFQKVVKGCEARTGVYYCGSTGELENYAISRWFWNPDEDPETIKLRWFSAYGAAGPAVRDFYEIIEERFTNPALYPPKAGHQNDRVAWKYLCTAEIEARLADCANRALSATGLTPRQHARLERWWLGTAAYVLSGSRMARLCNNQREGVVATRTLYKFRPIEPLARDVLAGAETLGCVLRDDRSAGGLVLRTPVLTDGAITNEVFADSPGKGITNILLAVRKPIDNLRRFRVIVSRRDPQRGRSAFAPVGRVNGRWIDLAGEQLIRKWTDDAVDTYDVFEFLFTPESVPAHLEGIGIRDFSAAVRHSATRFALLEAECAAADDLDEESVKIDFLAHGNDRVFVRVSVPGAEVIEPVGGIHFMVNPALWTKTHPKWQTMRVRVKSADGRERVKAVSFGIARLNGKLQVIGR